MNGLAAIRLAEKLSPPTLAALSLALLVEYLLPPATLDRLGQPFGHAVLLAPPMLVSQICWWLGRLSLRRRRLRKKIRLAPPNLRALIATSLRSGGGFERLADPATQIGIHWGFFENVRQVDATFGPFATLVLDPELAMLLSEEPELLR